jgi:hypothetical protein
MRNPGLILGYHGCDSSTADEILAGTCEVRPSHNSYDWLGTGAYFWENNPARALSWAKSLARSKRSKIKKPAILGAIIDPGNCLDLAEESSLEQVREAFEGFRQLCEILRQPLPVNESAHDDDADLLKRHLDCAVINFVHELRRAKELRPYDSVRAPFIEGNELFSGSKLRDKTHVQWCIRDPKSSIIAYFRPRNPEATEA